MYSFILTSEFSSRVIFTKSISSAIQKVSLGVNDIHGQASCSVNPRSFYEFLSLQNLTIEMYNICLLRMLSITTPL